MSFDESSVVDYMRGACRREPKRQLKRLYDTQDSEDAAVSEDARDDEDEQEEELLDPVFGKGTERSFPPIGRMSGLGPSDQAMQGKFSPHFCYASPYSWIDLVFRCTFECSRPVATAGQEAQ